MQFEARVHRMLINVGVLKLRDQIVENPDSFMSRLELELHMAGFWQVKTEVAQAAHAEVFDEQMTMLKQMQFAIKIAVKD